MQNNWLFRQNDGAKERFQYELLHRVPELSLMENRLEYGGNTPGQFLLVELRFLVSY